MPGLKEDDTIFLKIVRREVPAQILYQDDEITAFKDINPAAPTHVLIVPNKRISSLNEATAEDERLLGKIVLTAQRLAHELGIDQTGYRLVMNCNSDGGQSVYHLHFHLLGGRRMTWPPG
jgi:histidine triad (HIT) family protein